MLLLTHAGTCAERNGISGSGFKSRRHFKEVHQRVLTGLLDLKFGVLFNIRKPSESPGDPPLGSVVLTLCVLLLALKLSHSSS